MLSSICSAVLARATCPSPDLTLHVVGESDSVRDLRRTSENTVAHAAFRFLRCNMYRMSRGVRNLVFVTLCVSRDTGCRVTFRLAHLQSRHALSPTGVLSSKSCHHDESVCVVCSELSVRLCSSRTVELGNLEYCFRTIHLAFVCCSSRTSPAVSSNVLLCARPQSVTQARLSVVSQALPFGL